MKLYGEPHNVHITRDLFKQQESHTKRLEKKRKELLRKKAIQDGEKQRLRDAEKERQQEAQKLERMRLNLFKTGIENDEVRNDEGK